MNSIIFLFLAVEPVFKRIVKDTHWPTKTALKRITIIGIHHDISLLSYYSSTKQKLQTKRDLAPQKIYR